MFGRQVVALFLLSATSFAEHLRRLHHIEGTVSRLVVSDEIKENAAVSAVEATSISSVFDIVMVEAFRLFELNVLAAVTRFELSLVVFTSIVILSLLVFLLLKGGVFTVLTLKLLDTFFAVGMALFAFSCFGQFLTFFEAKDLFLVPVLQVLALYAVAWCMRRVWKDEKKMLLAFCTCGAHYISCLTVTSDGVGPILSLASCLIIGGFVLLLPTNSYFSRSKDGIQTTAASGNMLEPDMFGLTISFAITQAIRCVIQGKHQPLALSSPHQQSADRLSILVWTLFNAVVASAVIPKLDAPTEAKTIRKSMHVIKVTLAMLVTWGLLLWGQWEFLEGLAPKNTLHASLAFALLVTALCMFTLCLTAHMQNKSEEQAIESTSEVVLIAAAVVVAWAWESSMHQAINVAFDNKEPSIEAVLLKAGLVIGFGTLVLPSWLNLMRSSEQREESAHQSHRFAMGDRGS